MIKRKFAILIAAIIVFTVAIVPVDFASAETEVKSPAVKSWSRKSSTEMVITWEGKDDNADGYEIAYSQSKSFPALTTDKVVITKPEASKKTISKLDENVTYYVKIRAYAETEATVKSEADDTETEKSYSKWVKYNSSKKNKTVSAKQLKKSGSALELRTIAKQKVGGYDTLQGACTDGKYAYYVLYNRKTVKCKILKMKISNKKKVKVSKVLKIGHGNDITYNSNTKKLIVSHSGSTPSKLSVINPSSLKLEKTFKLKTPKTLDGASASTAASIKGCTAIAYSSVRGQYAARVKGRHDYIILNENFEAVKYIDVTKAGSNLNQSMDADGDFIYAVQSKVGYYNTVTVHDWDGNYLCTIKSPVKYEMESLYHKGSKFYVGVYRSYYKKYYKTKYKTKKVKGKKVKYKYKKAYWKLMRSNYMYDIGSVCK